MYELKVDKKFITIKASEIIDTKEANIICHKVANLLKLKSIDQKLLLDIRNLDLENSKLDIFIQSLSKIKVDKIALVLKELIYKLKFSLWKRRYNSYVKINQFDNLVEAKQWLL